MVKNNQSINNMPAAEASRKKGGHYVRLLGKQDEQ